MPLAAILCHFFPLIYYSDYLVTKNFFFLNLILPQLLAVYLILSAFLALFCSWRRRTRRLWHCVRSCSPWSSACRTWSSARVSNSHPSPRGGGSLNGWRRACAPCRTRWRLPVRHPAPGAQARWVLLAGPCSSNYGRRWQRPAASRPADNICHDALSIYPISCHSRDSASLDWLSSLVISVPWCI